MRRITIGLVLGLLFGSTLFGQSNVPLQRPNISGRVLRQNGEAAPRVVVTLLGPERYDVTTDARGAFAFSGMAPGTYSLVAHRPGYSAVKYGGTAALAVNCNGIDISSYAKAVGRDDAFTTLQGCIHRAPGIALTVKPNSEIKEVTLRISQVGVIRGKVTNQDLEGVPSQVVAMVKEPGDRTFRTVANASSMDQDGNYTVDDLPPGHYYLLAKSRQAQPGAMVLAQGQGQVVMIAQGQGQGQRQVSKTPADSDVSTYYPSAADELKALSVEVKAGEELRGMDIMMRRTQVFTIRGSVVVSGQAPANMTVTIAQKGSSNGMIGAARSAGPFEFRAIEPGTYIISGRSPGLFGSREVTVVSGDMEGVNVTMSPAAVLTGTVKMEGEAPAAWPSVTLTADDGTLSGALRPGPDGKFAVPPGLPPVAYAVHLDAMPRGTYVKSMSFGKQDVLHGKLDLSAGDSGSLDIVLSMNAATLTGKVTDATGAAVKGVQVTAWPRDAAPGAGVHIANTDQDGNFSITDLGPADYWMAAWEALPASLSGDAGFLGRFQNAAASVRLEEGSRAKADLKLIPREKSDVEAAKLP